jgi:hypothetical protein
LITLNSLAESENLTDVRENARNQPNESFSAIQEFQEKEDDENDNHESNIVNRSISSLSIHELQDESVMTMNLKKVPIIRREIKRSRGKRGARGASSTPMLDR